MHVPSLDNTVSGLNRGVNADRRSFTVPILSLAGARSNLFQLAQAGLLYTHGLQIIRADVLEGQNERSNRRLL